MGALCARRANGHVRSGQMCWAGMPDLCTAACTGTSFCLKSGVYRDILLFEVRSQVNVYLNVRNFYGIGRKLARCATADAAYTLRTKKKKSNPA